MTTNEAFAVNYYRRYVADYLAKTGALTMIEDGAYGRLLDWYYANEKPLPLALDRVYGIARATNAAEKKAVCAVLADHFVLLEDGYHNARADKELGIALPKLERLRDVARTNGAKGGRPKKTESGSENKTESGFKQEPNPGPKRKQPPASSLYPNPTPSYHSPGSNTTAAPAGTVATAALEALTLDQCRAEPDTPAGHLAAVCLANSIRATAFHPLVVEWAKDGVTVEHLRDAIAKARSTRKGDGPIPPSYLDPILADRGKAGPDSRWKSDDSAAEKLCRELGIPGAKIREERAEWHARISQALHERARSGVR